ncbi:hypothetical protein JTB14_015171 [Gonioctena quinquepunctata]|nr:hypothetical protein JTB14_015171 [Gonioctena quinquepunctata]
MTMYQLYSAKSFDVIDLADPLTVEEAMEGHDAELWKQAMLEEYCSSQENQPIYHQSAKQSIVYWYPKRKETLEELFYGIKHVLLSKAALKEKESITK